MVVPFFLCEGNVGEKVFEIFMLHARHIYHINWKCVESYFILKKIGDILLFENNRNVSN